MAISIPSELDRFVGRHSLGETAKHFQLERRRAVHQVVESAFADHEGTDRSFGDDGCVPWRVRDERDLAEELLSTLDPYLAASLADINFSVDQSEELAAAFALADEHLPGWDVDLVGERRDLSQLGLRAAREERCASEELDLRVLA